MPLQSGVTAEIGGDGAASLCHTGTSYENIIPSLRSIDPGMHSVPIQGTPNCSHEAATVVPPPKLEDPIRNVVSSTPSTSHNKVEYTSISFGDGEDEFSKL